MIRRMNSCVGLICLLDAKDDQTRKLGYLLPEWTEAVVHAVRVARRLGMDADMSPVPGWACGGPWVPREESCANVEVKHWDTAATAIRVGDLIRLIPDPASGRVKTLKVKCSINGKAHDLTANDGAVLEIPAKPQRVVVESARYGLFSDGPTVDVTAVVQQLVADQRGQGVAPLIADDLMDLVALGVIGPDRKATDLSKHLGAAGTSVQSVTTVEGAYYAG